MGVKNEAVAVTGTCTCCADLDGCAHQDGKGYRRARRPQLALRKTPGQIARTQSPCLLKHTIYQISCVLDPLWGPSWTYHLVCPVGSVTAGRLWHQRLYERL